MFAVRPTKDWLLFCLLCGSNCLLSSHLRYTMFIPLCSSSSTWKEVSRLYVCWVLGDSNSWLTSHSYLMCGRACFSLCQVIRNKKLAWFFQFSKTLLASEGERYCPRAYGRLSLKWRISIAACQEQGSFIKPGLSIFHRKKLKPSLCLRMLL